MKSILLSLTLLFCCNMMAQQYAHPSTLKVVHIHFKNDNYLYKIASNCLHQHHRQLNKSVPSDVDINVMAYKLNDAFRYFGLSAFYNSSNTKEFKHRLRAIKSAIKSHGLNLKPAHVNNAYNLIYGEVAHCSYRKGFKKPPSWKHKKSKPIRTLNNTHVIVGHSFVDPNTIVAQ